MRPIDQQVILVSGATDGLGRAVARELAARGATVLLHEHDPVSPCPRNMQDLTPPPSRLHRDPASIVDLPAGMGIKPGVVTYRDARLLTVDGPFGVVGGPPDDPWAVRDLSGRALVFDDPATCQTVAAFLAAAGAPPILAPVAMQDVPEARLVTSDQEAHEVLLDLLDAFARLRGEIGEIALRC